MGTLHLVLRLRGGKKKRKKKKYTTPKKIKHKRKKVKLSVLNYYKVDDNGKVETLRKWCTDPQCGVGVFMANHQDRLYCGMRPDLPPQRRRVSFSPPRHSWRLTVMNASYR